jgi:hypothetical protein
MVARRDHWNWEAKGKLRYPMALTQKQHSAARIPVYATAGRAKATLTTGRRARGEKDVFLRRYRCSGGGFWQGDTQSRLCSVSPWSQTVLQDALRSDAHALPPATNADFRNFPRRRVVPRTPGSGTPPWRHRAEMVSSPFRGTHTIHTPSHTVHTPSPPVIRSPASAWCDPRCPPQRCGWFHPTACHS